jgi:hypothetical protein
MAFKRSRGEKPEHIKKDAKHWRSVRTIPYEVGDQIGIKVYDTYFQHIQDVIEARQYPGTIKAKHTLFFEEMLSIAKAYSEKQIANGVDPFKPETMRYKGIRIKSQEFCDDLEWLKQNLQNYRSANNPNAKTVTYEYALQWAIRLGINLLYHYNLVVKKERIKI